MEHKLDTNPDNAEQSGDHDTRTDDLRSIANDAVEDTNPAEKSRVEYSVLTLANYKERVQIEQGFDTPVYPSDEAMRAEYIERTEKLMIKMAEKSVDTVVYLDKSARPISWFVKELWPVLMKNADKPMPEIKYANVDANAIMGRDAEQSRPAVEEIEEFVFTPEQLQELRQVFADPEHPGHHLFEGKKVMLVDEIFVSGASLQLAVKLFREAFPDSEFIGDTWVYGQFKEDRRMSRRSLKEVPVWYHNMDEMGRGVGDVEGGKHFVSRRFDRPDELANQLRREIHQLALDIQSGDQPIKPISNDESVYEGMTFLRAPKPERRSLFD